MVLLLDLFPLNFLILVLLPGLERYFGIVFGYFVLLVPRRDGLVEGLLFAGKIQALSDRLLLILFIKCEIVPINLIIG